ncbi:MAG: hemerythrin domain-containing protein [Planctomycetales bacterium]
MNASEHDVTFLGEILEEHAEQRRILARAEQAFRDFSDEDRSPRDRDLAGISDQLADLRPHLTRHFAFEERGGYLCEALEVAPRYSEEAAELQGQHAVFLKQLAEIEGRVRDFPFGRESWNAIQDAFEDFLATMSEHEHRENALVQSAFGDDVGVGD